MANFSYPRNLTKKECIFLDRINIIQPIEPIFVYDTSTYADTKTFFIGSAGTEAIVYFSFYIVSSKTPASGTCLLRLGDDNSRYINLAAPNSYITFTATRRSIWAGVGTRRYYGFTITNSTTAGSTVFLNPILLYGDPNDIGFIEIGV